MLSGLFLAVGAGEIGGFRGRVNRVPGTFYSVRGVGIQLTQQTGLGSDTGMCHSGQAKRSAGISSFRSRALVWEIPFFISRRDAGRAEFFVFGFFCIVVWFWLWGQVKLVALGAG